MTRSPIARLIVEAVRVYSTAGLDCGDALLPPAADAEVDAIAAALGLPVPAELRAVYRIHGGQRYFGAGVTGLFGSHRLLAPAEVIEHYRSFATYCLPDPLPAFPPAAGEWGYWVPTLLPFASWDAYDLCVEVVTGEVWDFIPNTGLTAHLPNIAAVLETVIAAVQAGREPEIGVTRGPA